MFPIKRQQLILAIVIAAAAVLQQSVAIHNHGAGFILLAPVDHAAIPVGVVGVLIGFVALGLAASVTGNPLAGQAVLATGLMILAARGGAIDRWLTNIETPRAMFSLAAEAVMWCVPVVAMALLTRYARPRLRRMLPEFLQCAYFDEGPEQEAPGRQVMQHAGVATLPILIGVGVVFGLQPAQLADFIGSLVLSLACLAVMWGVCLAGGHLADRLEGRERKMRAPIEPAFLAGVVTVAVGAVGVQLLVRSAATGQVIGGLMCSFMLAAMIGHQLFPTHGRLTMLLAPLAVCIGGFLWTGWHLPDVRTMLELFYHAHHQGLLPAAVVLPAFYASAGVLGAAIGIGWSQSLHIARDEMVLVAG